MTIREYIKIHTLDSFVNHYSIIVKPFSLCEKYNHYDLIEAESRIRQKVDKWIYLTFFNDTEWKNLNTVSSLKVHLMQNGEPAEELNDIEDVMDYMICYAYLFIPKECKWYYTKGKGLKPLKA